MRITKNLEGLKPDYSYNIPDAEALPVVFDLLQHEGLCLGASSGVNVAGAIRLAREMGPGHTIVTILCDFRYTLSVQIVQSRFPSGKRVCRPPSWLDRAPASIPGVFEDQ